jgi:hypothetical protein
MKQSDAAAVWDAIVVLIEAKRYDTAKGIFDVAVNATPTPVFDPHKQYPRGGQIGPADRAQVTINDTVKGCFS